VRGHDPEVLCADGAGQERRRSGYLASKGNHGDGKKMF
jgi:hypothetical protein